MNISLDFSIKNSSLSQNLKQHLEEKNLTLATFGSRDGAFTNAEMTILEFLIERGFNTPERVLSGAVQLKKDGIEGAEELSQRKKNLLQ